MAIGEKVAVVIGISLGSLIIFKGFKLCFFIVINLLVTIPSFSE
jgi:hypothetical protein